MTYTDIMDKIKSGETIHGVDNDNIFEYTDSMYFGERYADAEYDLLTICSETTRAKSTNAKGSSSRRTYYTTVDVSMLDGDDVPVITKEKEYGIPSLKEDENLNLYSTDYEKNKKTRLFGLATVSLHPNSLLGYPHVLLDELEQISRSRYRTAYCRVIDTDISILKDLMDKNLPLMVNDIVTTDTGFTIEPCMYYNFGGDCINYRFVREHFSGMHDMYAISSPLYISDFVSKIDFRLKTKTSGYMPKLVVLSKQDTKQGIMLKVYNSSMYHVETLTLESIYEEALTYTNVVDTSEGVGNVKILDNGAYMELSLVQGVFRYNMSKIADTFKRVTSNEKGVLASLLLAGYKCTKLKITENKELIEINYEYGTSEIKIPDTVEVIKKNSINLSNSRPALEVLILPKNLRKIDASTKKQFSQYSDRVRFVYKGNNTSILECVADWQITWERFND